jgi:ABC-type arginine transport system permease subunit
MFKKEYHPRVLNQELFSRKVLTPVIQMIGTLLSQVPAIAVSNATTILPFLADFLRTVQKKLSDLILIALPYFIKENYIFGSESRTVAKQIGNILEPILTACSSQVLGFVNGSIALISESELKSMFSRI